MSQKEQFTKYETARILGARGLQIAMDAPLLLKIPEEELKEMKYDALKIARKEFDEDVLPISVDRPMPARRDSRLKAVKEEKVSDEEIEAKEKEVEKEIEENAEEMGFGPDDEDGVVEEEKSEEQ